jgi:hypothetical protein
MNVNVLELMKSVPPEHFERLMKVQADIKDTQDRKRNIPDEYLKTTNSSMVQHPIQQKMRTS